MARIFAVANQKGGVGKSTTAINLSACLAEKGKKVLVVDLDPQGNTTSGLGINRYKVETSIYQLLINPDEIIESTIIQTAFNNLSVIPSNDDLAGAEIELFEFNDREFILRNKLDSVKKSYDYIFIDCPPSLSILTLNALCAAGSVLIPVQCEYYALEGLSQLKKTISLVRERLNPSLKIEGLIFTMYDGRTNLSSEVVQTVRENVDDYVFKTIIPRNIRLAEAPSYGMPISAYDPSSTGASRYRLLAEELEHREKGHKKKKKK